MLLLPTAVTLSWTPNSTMWIFLNRIIIYFNLNVFSSYSPSAFTLLSFNHTIITPYNAHRVTFIECFGVGIYYPSLVFRFTICTAFSQHLNAVAVWIIEQENWCIWNEPKTHRTLRSPNIILHFFRISFTSVRFAIVESAKCVLESKRLC